VGTGDKIRKDTDGIIIRINLKKNEWIPILSKALVQKTISEVHDAAHLGYKKTLKRLRSSFYWQGMYADVLRYISACWKCQSSFKGKQYTALPQNIEKEGIWQTLAMDFCGPFKIDEEGTINYVLVVIDMFTKFMEAIPTGSMSTDETIRALSLLFNRYGIP